MGNHHPMRNGRPFEIRNEGDTVTWARQQAIKREYLPHRYVVELRVIFTDPNDDPELTDVCQETADALRAVGYDIEYVEANETYAGVVRTTTHPRSD